MLPDQEARIEHARTASADELNSLIYEADEAILVALLDNPNFQEKHAELLLGRADVSQSVLTALAEAGKGKWTASESIRLRIAQHPHTAKRIALSALRQLFLFDLVRVSLQPSVPPDVRRAAEEAILVRVPHLAIGEKLTLARRGPARVAGAILAEGHPQAIKLALGNNFLTESQVLKVLAKDGVSERVVAAIARHARWRCVYNIRVALVRNVQTPLPCVKEFVGDLTLADLKEIATLRELSREVQREIGEQIERRTGKATEPKISGAA